MTVIKDILKENKRLYRISTVISDLSKEIKVPAFLVGGCVRDLLLEPEKHSADIDIMVEGDGIAFAHQLAKKLNVSLFHFQNLLQLAYHTKNVKLKLLLLD